MTVLIQTVDGVSDDVRKLILGATITAMRKAEGQLLIGLGKFIFLKLVNGNQSSQDSSTSIPTASATEIIDEPRVCILL